MSGEFIAVYKDVFSKDYCNLVIDRMEKAFKLGYGFSRQESEDYLRHDKDDNQIYPNALIDAHAVFSDEISHEFNKQFWDVCYAQYADKFSILKQQSAHTIHGNKLQKTSVGGGYHLWHCEHSATSPERLLAYIVYLNDVEEGGETEFLYQHSRLKPTQGTVVIFPAGFTHTHRGNPPLSNTKYIMTGWVEY